MKTSYKKQYLIKVSIKNTLIALCTAGTVLILSWLIRYSAYGIDLTDESFYLVWISNPFIYDGSITQFGFIYHPLYRMMNGDITALRQANILITFFLAWGLVYSFLTTLAVDLRESRITLLVASASLATTVLIFFETWLPTPSYNSLNLQALLITASGLILLKKNENTKSIPGWLLIGLGGWLAFMAKPSTGLLMAVGVFLYLIFARKLSIRMLVVTVIFVLTLLSISALLIDASLVRFVNRLQLGVEFSKHLAGGHTLSQILRIDNFQLGSKLQYSILFVAGVTFLAISSICAKKKKWQIIGLLISIAFFAFTALLTLGQIHRVTGLGQFQGLLIFGVIYATVFVAIAFGRLRALKSISLQQWLMAALFLSMPHVYAFGTNNNYWQAGISAAIFWLLAGLTLMAPLVRERASWMLLLPLALAAQTVTATLIQTGLEQPYRQPQPLRLNASRLEIGLQRSELILSEDYSEYIASAMATAKMAVFEPNTPLIDLSGQSPGILYAVGAEPIGQAWTIGGYPGSLKLAKAALDRTTCEKIATSWILFEPNGPRSIPIELMYSIGADFPNNYEKVGTWQTAGYPDTRTQHLYKPLRQNKTLMHCKKLRVEEKR